MSLTALLNLLAASGVAGTLLPVLIALVTQQHWSPRVKGLVTATLSLLGGLFAAWQQGQFAHGWQVAATVVFLTASTAYAAFWKPTGIAPLIEELTTFSRRGLPPAPQVKAPEAGGK